MSTKRTIYKLLALSTAALATAALAWLADVYDTAEAARTGQTC